MCSKLVPILLVGLLATLAAPLWAAEAAPAGEAAVAYANALALGNTARAWGLLSAQSSKGLTEAQWSSSFEKRQPTTKPSAATALRALAKSGQLMSVGEVLVRNGEAFVNVTGNVQITQTIVLVRESAGWRVDLAATDQVSSKEAAQSFLEAVREDARAASSQQGQRTAKSSFPLLRLLLRSEVKSYRVRRTDLAGDRATVVIGADLPVNLVLRAARSGAGWLVDLSRPLTSVDILASKPLQAAADAVDRQVCEEQLRKIFANIQMYTNRSDDMLPDPKMWMDQIRHIVPGPAPEMHCANDPTPGASYAYNSNLAGKKRREIGNPSMTPLVFESTAHKQNAADTGQSWPAEPWHSGGALVLYADGSIRQAARKPSFAVTTALPGRPSRSERDRSRFPRPGEPGAPGFPLPTPRQR